MPLLLATGFSIFPGVSENPTAWLMDDLAASAWRPPHAELVTRTLSVHYDVWERELGPLIEETKPDAIVCFGLSAKASGFTLETTARNTFALQRPDSRGVCAPGPRIVESGAATYPSALPLADLATALTEANLPHALSDDAGDYICNLVLYRALAHGAHAGFIHVPPFSVLSPARLRAGAQAILATSSRALRARRPS